MVACLFYENYKMLLYVTVSLFYTLKTSYDASFTYSSQPYTEQ